MSSVAGRGWRSAAALMVVCEGSAGRAGDGCNKYEVLLQTRTQGASFRNSVVFPGGVLAAADANPRWLNILTSFGYSPADFQSLHRAGSLVTPILQPDPVLRHIALRITAIRETFEELGFLVCSRQRKEEKGGILAGHLTDFDVKYWQNRVCENPEELLTLCSELKCYPDIWGLHYWSNWLTPTKLKKRFDTGFFLTALKSKPEIIVNSEVVKAEWQAPSEILSRSKELILYPPQVYELTRLSFWSDVSELISNAGQRSSVAEPVFYHATVRAKDGIAAVFPGDDLYPETIDYEDHTTIISKKPLEELRNDSKVAHRIEVKGSESYLVFKNFKPKNKEMGDRVFKINVTFS